GTVQLPLGSGRGRPEGLRPHFRKGDRLLVLVGKGRDAPGEGLTSYAMMPGGGDWYGFTEDDDPAVSEAKGLCRALAAKEVGERLRLMAGLLKAKPGGRARGVLRRGLEATREPAQRGAAGAGRRREEVGKE